MKKIISILFVLALLAFSACKTQEVGPKPQPAVNLEITTDEGNAATPPAQQTEETQKVETQPETAPETTQAPIETADSSASLPDETCNEAASFGFRSCLFEEEGDIIVNVKNAGRGDLQGAVYRFYDENALRLGQESQTFSLAVGADRELAIPLSKNEGTYKIDAHPVQGGKICSNKQIVIIPSVNCR